jgi:hypothetical protein
MFIGNCGRAGIAASLYDRHTPDKLIHDGFTS